MDTDAASLGPLKAAVASSIDLLRTMVHTSANNDVDNEVEAIQGIRRQILERLGETLGGIGSGKDKKLSEDGLEADVEGGEFADDDGEAEAAAGDGVADTLNIEERIALFQIANLIIRSPKVPTATPANLALDPAAGRNSIFSIHTYTMHTVRCLVEGTTTSSKGALAALQCLITVIDMLLPQLMWYEKLAFRALVEGGDEDEEEGGQGVPEEDGGAVKEESSPSSGSGASELIFKVNLSADIAALKGYLIGIYMSSLDTLATLSAMKKHEMIQSELIAVLNIIINNGLSFVSGESEDKESYGQPNGVTASVVATETHRLWPEDDLLLSNKVINVLMGTANVLKNGQTVRAEAFTTIGTICLRYPSAIVSREKQLLDLFLAVMDEMAKKKEAGTTLAWGLLLAFNRYMVTFGVSVEELARKNIDSLVAQQSQSRPRGSASTSASPHQGMQQVFQFLLASLLMAVGQTSVARYKQTLGALAFLRAHHMLFKEFLTKDCAVVFDTLVALCGHKNVVVKRAAHPTANACLQAIGCCLSEGIVGLSQSYNNTPSSSAAPSGNSFPNSISHTSTHALFGINPAAALTTLRAKITSLLASKDKYELSFAIGAAGHLARPLKMFLGGERVLMEVLMMVMSHCTSMLSRGQDALEETTRHFPHFLCTFANLVLEMSALPTEIIEPLEHILTATILLYPKAYYFPRMRALTGPAILQILLACTRVSRAKPTSTTTPQSGANSPSQRSLGDDDDNDTPSAGADKQPMSVQSLSDSSTELVNRFLKRLVCYTLASSAMYRPVRRQAARANLLAGVGPGGAAPLMPTWNTPNQNTANVNQGTYHQPNLFAGIGSQLGTTNGGPTQVAGDLPSTAPLDEDSEGMIAEGALYEEYLPLWRQLLWGYCDGHKRPGAGGGEGSTQRGVLYDASIFTEWGYSWALHMGDLRLACLGAGGASSQSSSCLTSLCHDLRERVMLFVLDVTEELDLHCDTVGAGGPTDGESALSATHNAFVSRTVGKGHSIREGSESVASLGVLGGGRQRLSLSGIVKGSKGSGGSSTWLMHGTQTVEAMGSHHTRLSQLEGTLAPHCPPDYALFLNLVTFFKAIVSWVVEIGPSANGGPQLDQPSTAGPSGLNNDSVGTQLTYVPQASTSAIVSHRHVTLVLLKFVAKAGEYPHVSGYYAMIAAMMGHLRLLTKGMSAAPTASTIGEPLELLLGPEIAVALSYFATATGSRINDTTNELQLQAALCLLSLPGLEGPTTAGSSLSHLQVAMKTALAIGSNSSNQALTALEHWLVRAPTAAQQDLLPIFMRFYPKYAEGIISGAGGGDSQLSRTEALHRERFLARLAKIIGREGLRLAAAADEMARAQHEEEGAILKSTSPSYTKLLTDLNNALSIDLRLGDTAISLPLRRVLPQIMTTALTSTDRKTSMAACEFLHAFFRVLIGKAQSKNLRSGSDEMAFFETFLDQMTRVIVALSVAKDPVVRELYHSLLMQLGHWHAYAGQEEHFKAVLCVLTDGLSGSVFGIGGDVGGVDATVRGQCATALCEINTWASEASTDLSNKRLDMLYNRLLMHLSMPNSSSGAAYAVLRLMPCLRQQDRLITSFALPLLQAAISALPSPVVITQSPSPDTKAKQAVSQSQEPITDLVTALEELAVQRSALFLAYARSASDNDDNPMSIIDTASSGTEGSPLSDSVRWLYLHSTDTNAAIRTSCMRLFCVLCMCLPGFDGPDGPRDWVTHNKLAHAISTENLDPQPDLTSTAVEAVYYKLWRRTVPPGTPASADVLGSSSVCSFWLDDLCTSLELYLWIFGYGLVKPARVLGDRIGAATAVNSTGVSNIAYAPQSILPAHLWALNVKLLSDAKCRTNESAVSNASATLTSSSTALELRALEAMVALLETLGSSADSHTTLWAVTDPLVKESTYSQASAHGVGPSSIAAPLFGPNGAKFYHPFPISYPEAFELAGMCTLAPHLLLPVGARDKTSLDRVQAIGARLCRFYSTAARHNGTQQELSAALSRASARLRVEDFAQGATQQQAITTPAPTTAIIFDPNALAGVLVQAPSAAGTLVRGARLLAKEGLLARMSPSPTEAVGSLLLSVVSELVSGAVAQPHPPAATPSTASQRLVISPTTVALLADPYQRANLRDLCSLALETSTSDTDASTSRAVAERLWLILFGEYVTSKEQGSAPPSSSPSPSKAAQHMQQQQLPPPPALTQVVSVALPNGVLIRDATYSFGPHRLPDTLPPNLGPVPAGTPQRLDSSSSIGLFSRLGSAAFDAGVAAALSSASLSMLVTSKASRPLINMAQASATHSAAAAEVANDEVITRGSIWMTLFPTEIHHYMLKRLDSVAPLLDRYLDASSGSVATSQQRAFASKLFVGLCDRLKAAYPYYQRGPSDPLPLILKLYVRHFGTVSISPTGASSARSYSPAPISGLGVAVSQATSMGPSFSQPNIRRESAASVSLALRLKILKMLLPLNPAVVLQDCGGQVIDDIAYIIGQVPLSVASETNEADDNPSGQPTAAACWGGKHRLLKAPPSVINRLWDVLPLIRHICSTVSDAAAPPPTSGQDHAVAPTHVQRLFSVLTACVKDIVMDELPIDPNELKEASQEAATYTRVVQWLLQLLRSASSDHRREVHNNGQQSGLVSPVDILFELLPLLRVTDHPQIDDINRSVASCVSRLGNFEAASLISKCMQLIKGGLPHDARLTITFRIIIPALRSLQYDTTVRIFGNEIGQMMSILSAPLTTNNATYVASIVVPTSQQGHHLAPVAAHQGTFGDRTLSEDGPASIKRCLIAILEVMYLIVRTPNLKGEINSRFVQHSNPNAAANCNGSELTSAVARACTTVIKESPSLALRQASYSCLVAVLSATQTKEKAFDLCLVDATAMPDQSFFMRLVDPTIATSDLLTVSTKYKQLRTIDAQLLSDWELGAMLPQSGAATPMAALLASPTPGETADGAAKLKELTGKTITRPFEGMLRSSNQFLLRSSVGKLLRIGAAGLAEEATFEEEEETQARATASNSDPAAALAFTSQDPRTHSGLVNSNHLPYFNSRLTAHDPISQEDSEDSDLISYSQHGGFATPSSSRQQSMAPNTPHMNRHSPGTDAASPHPKAPLATQGGQYSHHPSQSVTRRWRTKEIDGCIGGKVLDVEALHRYKQLIVGKQKASTSQHPAAAAPKRAANDVNWYLDGGATNRNAPTANQTNNTANHQQPPPSAPSALPPVAIRSTPFNPLNLVDIDPVYSSGPSPALGRLVGHLITMFPSNNAWAGRIAHEVCVLQASSMTSASLMPNSPSAPSAALLWLAKLLVLRSDYFVVGTGASTHRSTTSFLRAVFVPITRVLISSKEHVRAMPPAADGKVAGEAGVGPIGKGIHYLLRDWCNALTTVLPDSTPGGQAGLVPNANGTSNGPIALNQLQSLTSGTPLDRLFASLLLEPYASSPSSTSAAAIPSCSYADAVATFNDLLSYLVRNVSDSSNMIIKDNINIFQRMVRVMRTANERAMRGRAYHTGGHNSGGHYSSHHTQMSSAMPSVIHVSKSDLLGWLAYGGSGPIANSSKSLAENAEIAKKVRIGRLCGVQLCGAMAAERVALYIPKLDQDVIAEDRFYQYLVANMVFTLHATGAKVINNATAETVGLALKVLHEESTSLTDDRAYALRTATLRLIQNTFESTNTQGRVATREKSNPLVGSIRRIAEHYPIILAEFLRSPKRVFTIGGNLPFFRLPLNDQIRSLDLLALRLQQEANNTDNPANAFRLSVEGSGEPTAADNLYPTLQDQFGSLISDRRTSALAGIGQELIHPSVQSSFLQLLRLMVPSLSDHFLHLVVANFVQSLNPISNASQATYREVPEDLRLAYYQLTISIATTIEERADAARQRAIHQALAESYYGATGSSNNSGRGGTQRQPEAQQVEDDNYVNVDADDDVAGPVAAVADVPIEADYLYLTHTLVRGLADGSPFIRDLLLTYWHRSLDANSCVGRYLLLHERLLPGASSVGLTSSVAGTWSSGTAEWLQHFAILLLYMAHTGDAFTEGTKAFNVEPIEAGLEVVPVTIDPSASIGEGSAVNTFAAVTSSALRPMFASQVPVSRLRKAPASLSGFVVRSEEATSVFDGIASSAADNDVGGEGSQASASQAASVSAATSMGASHLRGRSLVSLSASSARSSGTLRTMIVTSHRPNHVSGRLGPTSHSALSQAASQSAMATYTPSGAGHDGGYDSSLMAMAGLAAEEFDALSAPRRRYHRSEEDDRVKGSILHSARIRHQRRVETSMLRQQQRSFVTMFGAYNACALPDVQVTPQSIVVPLQALCLYCPEIAAAVSSALTEAIVASSMSYKDGAGPSNIGLPTAIEMSTRAPVTGSSAANYFGRSAILAAAPALLEARRLTPGLLASSLKLMGRAALIVSRDGVIDPLRHLQHPTFVGKMMASRKKDTSAGSALLAASTTAPLSLLSEGSGVRSAGGNGPSAGGHKRSSPYLFLRAYQEVALLGMDAFGLDPAEWEGATVKSELPPIQSERQAAREKERGSRDTTDRDGKQAPSEDGPILRPKEVFAVTINNSKVGPHEGPALAAGTVLLLENQYIVAQKGLAAANTVTKAQSQQANRQQAGSNDSNEAEKVASELVKRSTALASCIVRANIGLEAISSGVVAHMRKQLFTVDPLGQIVKVPTTASTRLSAEMAKAVEGSLVRAEAERAKAALLQWADVAPIATKGSVYPKAPFQQADGPVTPYDLRFHQLGALKRGSVRTNVENYINSCADGEALEALEADVGVGPSALTLQGVIWQWLRSPQASPQGSHGELLKVCASALDGESSKITRIADVALKESALAEALVLLEKAKYAECKAWVGAASQSLLARAAGATGSTLQTSSSALRQLSAFIAIADVCDTMRYATSGLARATLLGGSSMAGSYLGRPSHLAGVTALLGANTSTALGGSTAPSPLRAVNRIADIVTRWSSPIAIANPSDEALSSLGGLDARSREDLVMTATALSRRAASLFDSPPTAHSSAHKALTKIATSAAIVCVSMVEDLPATSTSGGRPALTCQALMAQDFGVTQVSVGEGVAQRLHGIAASLAACEWYENLNANASGGGADKLTTAVQQKLQGVSNTAIASRVGQLVCELQLKASTTSALTAQSQQRQLVNEALLHINNRGLQSAECSFSIVTFLLAHVIDRLDVNADRNMFILMGEQFSKHLFVCLVGPTTPFMKRSSREHFLRYLALLDDLLVATTATGATVPQVIAVAAPLTRPFHAAVPSMPPSTLLPWCAQMLSYFVTGSCAHTLILYDTLVKMAEHHPQVLMYPYGSLQEECNKRVAGIKAAHSDPTGFVERRAHLDSLLLPAFDKTSVATAPQLPTVNYHHAPLMPPPPPSPASTTVLVPTPLRRFVDGLQHLQDVPSRIEHYVRDGRRKAHSRQVPYTTDHLVASVLSACKGLGPEPSYSDAAQNASIDGFRDGAANRSQFAHLMGWLEHICQRYGTAAATPGHPHHHQTPSTMPMSSADTQAAIKKLSDQYATIPSAMVVARLRKLSGTLLPAAGWDHMNSALVSVRDDASYSRRRVHLSDVSELLTNLHDTTAKPKNHLAPSAHASRSQILEGQQKIILPMQPFVYLYRSPHLVPTVDLIDTEVLVLVSKQRPKRVTMHCSDQRSYTFLAKAGDDLRIDERVQCVYAMCNRWMATSPSTSSSASAAASCTIKTYSVVPFDRTFGIVEWLGGTQVLGSLCGEEKLSTHYPPSMPRDPAEYGPMYERLSHIAKHYTQHPLPQDGSALPIIDISQPLLDFYKSPHYKPYLRSALVALAPSRVDFFDSRLAFINSTAAMSLVNYLLGVGDRHLKNHLIDCRTAEIIPIDFGMCFGHATTDLGVAELVPFRLTKQMTDAIGPFYIPSLLHPMATALTAIRKQRKLLSAMLSVYLREPAAISRRVDAKAAVNVVEQKLSLHNPCDVLMGQVRMNATPSIAANLTGIDMVIRMGVGAQQAQAPTRTTHRLPFSKGEGQPMQQQSSRSNCLNSEQEMVETLLSMATDPDLLTLMWIGWSPAI